MRCFVAIHDINKDSLTMKTKNFEATCILASRIVSLDTHMTLFVLYSLIEVKDISLQNFFYNRSNRTKIS